MHGLTVFPSVQSALRAGYQVCDRTEYGYLVRTRTNRGWAFAIVDLRGEQPTETRRPG